MNVYKFLEEFRSRYYSQLTLIVNRYDLYKNKSCIIQDTFLNEYSCGFAANFDPLQPNFIICLNPLKNLSIYMKFDTWFNREIELSFIHKTNAMFSVLFSKNKTTIKFHDNFRYEYKGKDSTYKEFKEFLRSFLWNRTPIKTLDINEDVSMAILMDDQRISLSLFDMILSDLEN